MRMVSQIPCLVARCWEAVEFLIVVKELRREMMNIYLVLALQDKRTMIGN